MEALQGNHKISENIQVTCFESGYSYFHIRQIAYLHCTVEELMKDVSGDLRERLLGLMIPPGLLPRLPCVRNKISRCPRITTLLFTFL